MDAVEIAMGKGAHEQLVDLELGKTDLVEIAPQDEAGCGTAREGERIAAR